MDNVIIISDEDSDSDVEFVGLNFNLDPGINDGGQSDVYGEQEDKIPDCTQYSVDCLQPSNESVYKDEIIEIRVNYQICDTSNTAQEATGFQNSHNVEGTELAGDIEIDIDTSEMFVDSFMCYPERVDICDDSYLMGLPSRECVNETDELAYVDEKNRDESINKEWKQKNICGQEFASFHDTYDSQVTDFSAREQHVNETDELAYVDEKNGDESISKEWKQKNICGQEFASFHDTYDSQVTYFSAREQHVNETDELAYMEEKNGYESINKEWKQKNICGQEFASFHDTYDCQVTDFSAREQLVNETDELAYMDEKNGDESINKEWKQKNICGQEFASFHDTYDSQVTDFSAREQHVNETDELAYVDEENGNESINKEWKQKNICGQEFASLQDTYDSQFTDFSAREQHVNETDELAYMDEKNGDESINKKWKQKNICGQEFASLQDTYDSQVTDFSAREQHEQTINKEKQCHCRDSGLACSTKRLSQHNIIHTGEKPYKCDICGKGFTTNKYLPTHKRIHTGEKPYQCDICGKEFNDRSYLPTHKRIHTREKPHKCDICRLEYADPSSFRQHKNSHLGKKPCKCDICGLKYADPSVFRQHKNSHLGKKPYKCDICGLEYADPSAFRRHKNSHLGKKPCKCDICGKVFGQSNHLTTHKRIHTTKKLYKCNTCGLNFTQRSSMRQHKRKHTEEKPYKCDVSGQGFIINSSLRPRKRTQTRKKPFKCDVCEKVFYFSCSLSKHKRTHAGEQPCACDTCGRKYADANAFRRHKNSHLGKKAHKCDVCGKGFCCERYLTTHKKIHKGEHSLKCNWCGLQCVDYDDLTRHKNMHTSEKCRCDICGKNFSKSRYVLLHKRVHTREHQCKICGLHYSDSNGLRLHLKRHAGVKYKCDICGKMLKNRNSLPRHKRIHTGEKPYKCLFCGLQFIDSSGLKRHKHKHSGEKYECEVCGKLFRNSKCLLLHRRIHKGKKQFACDICGLLFIYKYGLKQHEESHTEEKCECDVCGKSFRNSKYLPIHKRIHTGEKPYKCDTCGVCYIDRSSLSKHKKVHM